MVTELKKQILHVEQNADSAEVICSLLEEAGYKVISAKTIEAAMSIAKQNEGIDLYLLDSKFADGTGIALCKRLHILQPNVPILFYSSDDTPEKMMDAGASGAILKPDIQDELKPTILRLITEARLKILALADIDKQTKRK